MRGTRGGGGGEATRLQLRYSRPPPEHRGEYHGLRWAWGRGGVHAALLHTRFLKTRVHVVVEGGSGAAKGEKAAPSESSGARVVVS